jgi:nucleoid-associated protein YgaU
VARLTQELESLPTHGPERASAAERSTEKPAEAGERAREAQPAPMPAATVKTHKVRQKETLSGIAGAVYGDRNQWKRILDANSVQLKGDPKRLREGMELTIP